MVGKIKVTEKRPDKRELLELLYNSEFYTSRKKQALEGEKVEEFIKELEQFTASLWRSLYDLNQDMAQLKEKIGQTETKSTKLEEFVLSQLFNNVTDGVTN